MKIIFTIILGLIPGSIVVAEEVAATQKVSYVMCKSGALVRTIRVEKKNRSCRTTYTKDGVENIVGKSLKDELCYDVFEKIRANLEKGAWKCRDISSSRVSYSE